MENNYIEEHFDIMAKYQKIKLFILIELKVHISEKVHYMDKFTVEAITNGNKVD